MYASSNANDITGIRTLAGAAARLQRPNRMAVPAGSRAVRPRAAARGAPVIPPVAIAAAPRTVGAGRELPYALARSARRGDE